MGEVERITKLMEEMARYPKEEMGRREPGEMGMYEKSQLASPGRVLYAPR